MASSVAHPLGSLQSPEVSFGTDGLRGRVGTAITPALALQVGFWCGRVLPPDGPVLIGDGFPLQRFDGCGRSDRGSDCCRS